MLKIDRRDFIQGAALTTALAAFATVPAEAAGSYYVIAEATAKPGSADALRELLLGLAAKSRTEAGCKSYTLLEVAGEPGHFLTFEVWVDKAALQGHMTTSHVKAAIPKIIPTLVKPFTQKFMAALST